jgi:hypothetical protein
VSILLVEAAANFAPSLHSVANSPSVSVPSGLSPGTLVENFAAPPPPPQEAGEPSKTAPNNRRLPGTTDLAFAICPPQQLVPRPG